MRYTPCLAIKVRILEQSGSNSLDSKQISVTRRARYLETLLNHFQSRFKWEYLAALHNKHHSKQRTLRYVVKIGNILQIHKDKIPKNSWPMGKVIRY